MGGESPIGTVELFVNDLVEVSKIDGNDHHLLDAVIDKDLTAAKLGRVIRAQELWIITDVDYVYLRFKKEGEKAISSMTTIEAENYLLEGEFKKGSMAPKIKAALYFLKHYGEKVVITSIPSINEAIHGKAGTEIIKA